MNSEEIVALMRIRIKAQLSLDKAKHLKQAATLAAERMQLAQAAARRLSLPPAGLPRAAKVHTAAAIGKQWYYLRAGQTEGPVSEPALRNLLFSLPPDTQVWNHELPGWMSARQVGLVPPPLPK
jgi:hypothetical protein